LNINYCSAKIARGTKVRHHDDISTIRSLQESPLSPSQI